MQRSWRDYFKAPNKDHAIHVIGAGSIVKDAHLPAYRKGGFKVESITDLDLEKAEKLAREYSIPHCYRDIESLVERASNDAVYDLAVPASALVPVLKQLPDHSAVLIQKPMGEDFAAAKEISEICREKKLTASVNFQLRFAPYIQAVRELVEQGDIGSIHDMDVRLNVFTPWHLFEFLQKEPRLEIQYHSIHYIDCIRYFLGDPTSVYAKTLKDPWVEHLSSTRTHIIMDYGEMVRANIYCNHNHRYGEKYQESYIKWEGSKGAIRIQLGLLLNYPEGKEDLVEICRLNDDGTSGPWEKIEVEGSWFPDAFIGTMANLQHKKEDSASELVSDYRDALKTMACVEAAYEASAKGGVRLPE